MTPLHRIARALWLKRNPYAKPEGWGETIGWYEREVAAGRETKDSEIFGCVRTAEGVCCG